MSQPQKGICAEPNLHAQYLMYNVLDDDSQALRAKLARVLDIFAYFDDEHYEAMVCGVIAIGSDYFSEIYPGLRPLELSPFPDMQAGDRCAPSQTSDLFIQIRADRLDIVHAIATEVHELLRLHVELIEDLKGFRYLDGRDLNGFVETDDNPRGPEKLAAAVIGDADPDFVGGSYIHTQKYRHDLRRWSLLSERHQEQIMGRTKEHNLPSAEANASSHYIRTRNADDGFHDNHNQIVRQSMPYANIQVQGLFQVTCSASTKPFKSMLHSMIFGGPDGEYDAWLDYTNAESGGAYFAPSIEFIRKRAQD
ncbi:Dyp-type peroxidase [Opacimonas viscosa]|uniref:Dyp-type peroxidase n=1 Tax=Opacimonas viscosa TaxID=2961944 RepID=A0AA41WZR4_9ALTE|nr:Dyp-type peroxidase [Opacimonas viscosa]MCP3429290.1 Dyp-type peroxidase [Opacimonas viscosa]